MNFRHRIVGHDLAGHTESELLAGGKRALKWDSWLRVTYQSKVLSVFVGTPKGNDPAAYFLQEGEDAGEAGEGGEGSGEMSWRSCVTMKNVELPPRGYFGFSASTGDLHDAHELISFRVRPFGGFGIDDNNNDQQQQQQQGGGQEQRQLEQEEEEAWQQRQRQQQEQ